MPFCVNCGQKLADGAKFCANCGKAVIEQNTAAQRKTVFDGELHKCPNCGELISAFVTVCPSCSYEIRGAKASSIVKEFSDKLEQIEKARESQKSRSFISKLYGSDGQLNKTDEQKISLIRSFSIPNTKEDIFEFVILAASNIDLKLYGLGDRGVITASQRAVSDAWIAKLEQAYEKAQLSFGSTPEFSNLKAMYEKKLKKLKWKKLELPLLVGGIFLFFIIEVLFIVAIT